MNEEISIQRLRGIGKSRAEALGRLGIASLFDLIRYLPSDYMDCMRGRTVVETEDGEAALFYVTLLDAPKMFTSRNGARTVSVQATDGTQKLNVLFFNQSYMMANLKSGVSYYFYGTLSKKRGAYIINPKVFSEPTGIVPIYRTVKGIPQSVMRSAVREALDMRLNETREWLTDKIRDEFGLMPLADAAEGVHFPRTFDELAAARKRLLFDESFSYFIALRCFLAERRRAGGISFKTAGVRERLETLLPFKLTRAQKRVMDDIANDMASQDPMNRLIQGDVGSGKTAAAVFAMLVANENGLQSVIMSPTEILARQHYEKLKAVFGDKACLVTGGMSEKERRGTYSAIASGEYTVISGTHALLEDKVEFKRLGLVISDEQHRFGVAQRAKMAKKGASPDVLVMSATPIPRTLSLILYGDLDISVIDELPPGRKPIKTCYVSQAKRGGMYRFIRDRALAGEQAYVICPLIESSESLEHVSSACDVYEELSRKLDVTVGLLHGRMKSAEKENVFERFRRGEISVLVSTTVIEVGVDVKNASIMAIESADRLGLAQLHQLRGRVGRGDKESYCFLLGDATKKTAKERMKLLTETSDGFEIAKKDLEMRGPGEFIGKRQHGANELAEMFAGMDMRTLDAANRAAAKTVKRMNDDAEARRMAEHALGIYGNAMESIAFN